MATADNKLKMAATAEDDWAITYPPNWPVLNPYADEARTEEERVKFDEEIGYQLPSDPVVYYGPLEEGQEAMEVGYGDPCVPIDPERRLWVGMAALAEANLKLTVGNELAYSDQVPDQVDEKALLKQWPVMLHTRGSSGSDTDISEISKFMTQKYPDDPDWAHKLLKTAEVVPEQFVKLIVPDDTKSAHMAVAVAMLWGWLPAKMSCPECNSTMKLVEQPKYKDCLEWRCNNDGSKNTDGQKKSKKAKRSKRRKIDATSGRKSVTGLGWKQVMLI